MKNFEAYKDYISIRGTDAMAIKNGEAIDCKGTPCEECLFKLANECVKRKGQWLYEEYKKPKIKIPLATKIILENLKDNWKWIAKDQQEHVKCFNEKPQKYSWQMAWESDNKEHRYLTGIFDNNLFDFLSWDDEEPTNIKELLENCEVIDDE